MTKALKKILAVVQARFYQLLLLAAFAYMVFLALEYSRCWQDFDNAYKFFEVVIRNSPRLQWEDFTRIFNAGYEGFRHGPPTRLRYLQDLVFIIDVKFRIWIFNYMPPHPSLTLMWLSIFFVAPYLMFKLVYQLTASRSAGYTGAILFALSTGNMFGVTKLSNPAKPLANLFCLAILYLAALFTNRVMRRTEEDSAISLRDRFLYVLLLLVLLISFFADETSWIFYLLIPAIFPAIFRLRRVRGFTITGYLALLPVTALLVFFVFPFLLNTFTPGGVTVDYFSDYFQDYDATGPFIPPFYGPRYILLTARNLAWTQLVPWGWFWGGIIYLSLLAGYLVFQFRHLSLPQKKLIFRLLATLGIFILYQSYAIGRTYWVEGYILKYPMYYGALFSVFFTIPLAILLSPRPGRYSGLVNKGLLAVMAVVLAYNFARINEDSRFIQCNWENAGEMDYATSREIWSQRDDLEAIRRYRDQYPMASGWAYIREIEVIAEQLAGER